MMYVHSSDALIWNLADTVITDKSVHKTYLQILITDPIYSLIQFFYVLVHSFTIFGQHFHCYHKRVKLWLLIYICNITDIQH